jgi:hypothetical protein
MTELEPGKLPPCLGKESFPSLKCGKSIRRILKRRLKASI